MSQEQDTEIQPISEKPHSVGNGVQKLYRFDNGYGASVVQFMLPSFGDYPPIGGSYGADTGLWELGVIVWTGEDFRLTYETPITDDVLGDLSDEDVERTLREIRDLPARKS